MLEGSKADFRSTRYNISPGDGSRYDFSLVWLEEQPDTRQVIRGVGDGTGFVGLVFHGIGRQGTWEVRKSSLQEPHPHFISYLRDKMGLPQKFTWDITAIVLAARQLVLDPDGLEAASDAMLGTKDMINARRPQQDPD
jgi:hypothetical protein